MLSFECHSPIIAAVNSTPFFYLRQSEDTIKGQMYYDLGFEGSIFEIDSTSGKQVADRLLEVEADHNAAVKDLNKKMKSVNDIFSAACRMIDEFTF